MIQEMKHALRRLRKAPAFTASTVLTLALGIGATTAMFTLVHAVLLKSLPVAHPGDLYRVGRETRCCYLSGYSQPKEFSLVSYDLYAYLRDHTTGFTELAAFSSNTRLFGVRRASHPESAQSYSGEFVSGNYFAMFGLTPFSGRLVAPADDQPGAVPVVAMSFRLWQERYGADATIIGSIFNVNGKPFTIVGITPPGFFGDSLRATPPDLFFPLHTEPLVESDDDLEKYDTHWLQLIGRIQRRAEPDAVEAQMRVELKQWLRSHWAEMSANDRAVFPEQTLFLSPGGAGMTSMRQQYEEWLLILMAVTGMVLLIVCTNVANLMLVRGQERRQQVALNMALRAQPSRVVREPLLESLLLSLAGGGVGLVIAFAGTRLMLQLAFPSPPGHAAIPIDPSPSPAVLFFAGVTSLATGMAFGLAPAWIAARVDPMDVLRGSSRATTQASSLPWKVVVALQTVISLVLLSSAGLLTAAVQRLQHQSFGFEQERRLVATLNPRLAGYRSAQLSQLYRRIHDAMADIPGVASVALCLYAPPGADWGTSVWLEGRPAPGPQDDNSSLWNRVTSEYFEVIGTPILKGRSVSAQDTATTRKVAVISESFARRFFGNDDPIGKHFGRRPDASDEFEIIGIAQDATYAHNLGRPTGPVFFLPEAQAEYAQANLGSLFLQDMVIVTRPGARVPLSSIYQGMASVNPDLPISSIRTMRERVSSQLTQARLIARLTSVFGALALALAAVGLYGVTAHTTGQRRNEIGVRVALGARRADVVHMVLRDAFGVIACGLLIGVPLSWAAGYGLRSQLFGMNSYNPAVTIVAVATLGVSGLVAAIIPALRASLMSPSAALRTG